MTHRVLKGKNTYGQSIWETQCPVCKTNQRGEGWQPHNSKVICQNCGVHYTALLKDFEEDYRKSLEESDKLRKAKIREGYM